MKPKKENQWVAEDSESENGVGSKVVEETQQVAKGAQEALDDGEEQYLGEMLSSRAERAQDSTKLVKDLNNDSASGSSSEFEDDSDHDELDDYEQRTESKVRGKRIRNNDSNAKTTKSAREKGKNKDKDTDTADKAKQKKRPTINPNAVSHQNFRSLKIRNKNSKAKGGKGRFGRKGR
jgi:hypothetical protein